MTTVKNVINLVGTIDLVILVTAKPGNLRREFVPRVEKLAEALCAEHGLKSAVEAADLPPETKLGRRAQRHYRNLDAWWEQNRP